MPVFGGGKTKFQPVYVWDVANAIVKSSSDPKFYGKTFELGGPNGTYIHIYYYYYY